jgi:hypothetical protein
MDGRLMLEEHLYIVSWYPLGGNIWEVQLFSRPLPDMIKNVNKVYTHDNISGVDSHTSYHVNVIATSLSDAIGKGEEIILKKGK